MGACCIPQRGWQAQKEEIRRLKEEAEPGQKIVEERKMSWNEEQAVIDVEASPKVQLRKSDGDKNLNNTMSMFAVSSVGKVRRDAVVSAVKLTSGLEVSPKLNKPDKVRYATHTGLQITLNSPMKEVKPSKSRRRLCGNSSREERKKKAKVKWKQFGETS